MKVAALYVDAHGVYAGRPDVEVWDVTRDARKYAGPWPVVAHPPCQLWTNLARVNFKRYGGEHNRPGNDGGCFASALAAVRRFGGVLEHPADSWAWPGHNLTKPLDFSWTPSDVGWTCEVWQSAYGHKARKRTWLYCVSERKPQELDWTRNPGTHQCGWFDRKKPTLGKREAMATPPMFAELLLTLARGARGFGV